MIGVVGVDLTLGQCDRLAAEPADLLKAFDASGQFAHHRAAHFVVIGAFGDILADQFVEPLFDQCRIDPRLDRRADGEDPDPLEREHPGRNPDRELFVADQHLVETRAGKAAEHRTADIERDQLAVEQPRHRPVSLDLDRRDAVLHHFGLGHGQRRDRSGGGNIDRTARDRAEIFLDHRAGLGRADIAGENDHRIVRRIFVGEPLFHIGEAGGVEIGHRADRQMLVGMTGGEDVLEHFVEDEPAGLIIALALLVLDHAALVIEHALGNRAEQVPHAVRFHEQSPLERAARDGFEIIGAVECGGAVVIGRADLLQISEIIAGQIFRAVEHQMFEQMRETGLAPGLVLRPDIIPGADRDHRRLAILVDDDGEAIVELERRMRNHNLADQYGYRSRLGDCRFAHGRQRGKRGLAGSGGASGEHRRAGKQDIEADRGHRVETPARMASGRDLSQARARRNSASGKAPDYSTNSRPSGTALQADSPRLPQFDGASLVFSTQPTLSFSSATSHHKPFLTPVG